MLTLTKAQLLEHLHMLATVDGAAAPPEQAHIEAAASALPEGTYVLYDPEQGQAPGWLNVLPVGATLAEWPGTAEGSWGYGDVRQLPTQQGPGLVIALAGSSLQSAASLFVVPAQAVEVAGQPIY